MLAGAAFVGMGFFIWKADTEPEIKIVHKADEGVKASEIVVDIEGEVVRPGVYKLPAGSRVADVITVGGGLTQNADVNWIDARINRAEKIEDGYKLYVPNKNTLLQPAAGNKQVNVISINDATSAQLENLPGIGEVTAGKIIQARPYNKLTELTEKKVVTQKVFEEIKLLIGL